MHEMGIAMEILDIVQASIPNEMTGVQVKKVNLKVGRLAAVVPDSLRFCFKVAADKTAASGAELAIEEIDVTARCSDCRHQWTVTTPVFVCPACNSGRTEMLSGRELEIVSIEIAEEELPDADL
jgi:hydrogenase nickel incorporation protein HypA/HybF